MNRWVGVVTKGFKDAVGEDDVAGCGCGLGWGLRKGSVNR